MTLNWGIAIFDRLFDRLHIKPTPVRQSVVVQTAPTAEPGHKPKPLDFDDLLRAMGADL